MSNDQSIAFAKRLLDAVPELSPVCEGHSRDNGEVLGHVLMADITRYVILSWVNQRDTPVSLASLLEFFECELVSGNEYAANVIALSFCENVMGDEQALGVLRPMMGPRLSGMMNQVFDA